jgi:hypothetical protein
MKLGLDFSHIKGPYQAQLLKLAVDTFKRGGKVFIIGDESTLEMRNKTIELMTLYRIPKPFWVNMYSVSEYLGYSSIPKWNEPNGAIRALRKKDWDSLRAKLSTEIGLDLFIGDKQENQKYFPPGVFCLME